MYVVLFHIHACMPEKTVAAFLRPGQPIRISDVNNRGRFSLPRFLLTHTHERCSRDSTYQIPTFVPQARYVYIVYCSGTYNNILYRRRAPHAYGVRTSPGTQRESGRTLGLFLYYERPLIPATGEVCQFRFRERSTITSGQPVWFTARVRHTPPRPRDRNALETVIGDKKKKKKPLEGYVYERQK